MDYHNHLWALCSAASIDLGICLVQGPSSFQKPYKALYRAATSNPYEALSFDCLYAFYFVLFGNHLWGVRSCVKYV